VNLHNVSPKQLVSHWIDLFNNADVCGFAELYHDDAMNHQVVGSSLVAKVSFIPKKL